MSYFFYIYIDIFVDDVKVYIYGCEISAQQKCVFR